MDPVVQVLIDRIERRASDIGHLKMQLADTREQLNRCDESSVNRGRELERVHARNAILSQHLNRIAERRNGTALELRQLIELAFSDLGYELPPVDPPSGKLPE
jgi:chromosome segregation ATPase